MAFVVEGTKGSAADHVTEESNVVLAAIPDVAIDADGVFKYILVKVTKEGASKVILAGHAWGEYHADIFARVQDDLYDKDVDCVCLGGGRIRHTAEDKTLLVYGYSMGFGRGDHEFAVGLLTAAYPDYVSISYTNEGY